MVVDYWRIAINNATWDTTLWMGLNHVQDVQMERIHLRADQHCVQIVLNLTTLLKVTVKHPKVSRAKQIIVNVILTWFVLLARKCILHIILTI